jgi:hypothetical protein
LLFISYKAILVSVNQDTKKTIGIVIPCQIPSKKPAEAELTNVFNPTFCVGIKITNKRRIVYPIKNTVFIFT